MPSFKTAVHVYIFFFFEITPDWMGLVHTHYHVCHIFFRLTRSCPGLYTRFPPSYHSPLNYRIYTQATVRCFWLINDKIAYDLYYRRIRQCPITIRITYACRRCRYLGYLACTILYFHGRWCEIFVIARE